jgi:hypothetical protein
MIPIRSFNRIGIEAFSNWLAACEAGGSTTALTSDERLSEPFEHFLVDPNRKFSSRYEFGCYLQQVFVGRDVESLLASESDGMWAWLNALYFPQLAPTKVRREEHYIPIRRGSAGSLVHRNAARTAFELVAIHGENARFALQQKMHTHGQLLESLSASQGIVRNAGFFAAAARMYVLADGTLKRGAASKPKNPLDRKPGDDAGKGSIRRLPIALKRLDLTYDVEVLTTVELVALLPKEYSRWTRADISRS